MASPSDKPFRLKADEIVSLAPGYGSCIASDMITCEGRKVSFMYREHPSTRNAHDSGWRFFSGYESEEYTDDPDNFAIYDVNTIANYDPDIIEFLEAPPGCAFERPGGKGDLAQAHDYVLPSD